MSKKIHRFRIDTIPQGNHITITEERLVHQLNRVLRLAAGEEIILFSDEGIDTVFCITDITNKGILLTLVRTHTVTQPTHTLIAAIGIPKGDAFELIVQKLTEIGVSEIVPLITSRTVKQSVRVDRLQAISDEALEQSGGTRRVLIREPISLATALETYPYQSVYFDTDTTKKHTLEKTATMIMYIGPEGGWSPEDAAVLANKSTPATLGPRVFRTETAAIIGAYTLLW